MGNKERGRIGNKEKGQTHPAYDWGVAAVIAERVRPLTSNSTRVACDS